MTDKREEVWTYTGRALLVGETLGHGWIDAAGKARYYGKKLAPSASVGARYRVWCDDSTVVLSGEQGPRFVDRIEGPQVVEWEAADRATALRHAAIRAEKRENGRSPYKEALAPIRFAYERATWQQRQLILADVVAQITGRVG